MLRLCQIDSTLLVPDFDNTINVYNMDFCTSTFRKSGTKKVESIWHSRNIILWNLFDFKSAISTRGDYLSQWLRIKDLLGICTVHQIFFEKLILRRIEELEIINGTKVGGKQQHGFMKNKSKVTAGLILQSLIAHVMDDDCCMDPWCVP